MTLLEKVMGDQLWYVLISLVTISHLTISNWGVSQLSALYTHKVTSILYLS